MRVRGTHGARAARLATAWSVVAMAACAGLAACTDDGATGADTSDTIEPGTSPLTGVHTNVTKTAPTPNPQCAAADVIPGSGAKYPWGGFSVGGKTYTCDACPNGHGDMQGSYRFHGYDDGNATERVDYSYPDPAEYKEVVKIDGNTFYTAVEDNIEGHSAYYTRGWYFCTQPPENGSKHIFWVSLDSDDPAQRTSVSETDPILSDGPNNTLLFFYDEVGGSTGTVRLYCRIGSQRDGQTCTDPFAQ